jgi:hypothetical protein
VPSYPCEPLARGAQQIDIGRSWRSAIALGGSAHGACRARQVVIAAVDGPEFTEFKNVAFDIERTPDRPQVSDGRRAAARWIVAIEGPAACPAPTARLHAESQTLSADHCASRPSRPDA